MDDYTDDYIELAVVCDNTKSIPKLICPYISDGNSLLKNVDEKAVKYYLERPDYFLSYSLQEYSELLGYKKNKNDEYIKCTQSGKIKAYTHKNVRKLIKTKNGEKTRIAKAGDINYFHNKADLTREWEVVIDEIIKTEADQAIWKECRMYRNSMLTDYKTKENYARALSGFKTQAIIAENGTLYHQREFYQLEWDVMYYDRFIKNLDPNKYIILLNCKMN